MSGLPSAPPSSSSSDRDSMSILDALLKLKEQQQQQQVSQEPSASNSSLSNPGVLFQGGDSTNSQFSCLPQTMPGLSSLGIHPSLYGLLSTMDLQQHSQQQSRFLASQLAAVSQSGSAPAPPLMPPPSVTPLTQQIQALQQAVAAGLPSLNNNGMQLATASAAASSIENSSKKQETVKSPSMPSPTKSASLPARKDSVASVTSVSSNPATVRTEKVEEALRSKPQRGKKRDDLSEKERMELTRTRNREHAKSTRLRKKARYQELLDSEEQLKQSRETEALRKERIDCLQKFLAVREAMLNSVATEPAASTSSSTPVAVPSKLEDLVEQVETFSFEVHGHKPMPTHVSSASLQHEADHQQGMLLLMQRWDRDINKRFRRQAGNEAAKVAPSFHYILQDGIDGVAISENGTGFARVNLHLKQDQDSSTGTGGASETKLALTGILTVHFAPTSSRLSSAIWTTTHYVPSFSVDFSRSDVHFEAARAAAPPLDDPSSASNDSSTLENQTIHPSVVSLEVRASHTENTESPSPGPGMTI